jgi:hypothetical protein
LLTSAAIAIPSPVPAPIAIANRALVAGDLVEIVVFFEEI